VSARRRGGGGPGRRAAERVWGRSRRETHTPGARPRPPPLLRPRCLPVKRPQQLSGPPRPPGVGLGGSGTPTTSMCPSGSRLNANVRRSRIRSVLEVAWAAAPSSGGWGCTQREDAGAGEGGVDAAPAHATEATRTGGHDPLPASLLGACGGDGGSGGASGITSASQETKSSPVHTLCGAGNRGSWSRGGATRLRVVLAGHGSIDPQRGWPAGGFGSVDTVAIPQQPRLSTSGMVHWRWKSDFETPGHRRMNPLSRYIRNQYQRGPRHEPDDADAGTVTCSS